MAKQTPNLNDLLNIAWEACVLPKLQAKDYESRESMIEALKRLGAYTC